MKRFTLIFFCAVAAFLIIFLVAHELIKLNTPEVVRSKVVIPVAQNQTEGTDTPETFSTEEITSTSLIQLNLDETLITTLSIDFNEDSFEDQIIAIKKANNPNIILIIGLYNVNSGIYERTLEIQTEVFQVKTFTMMAMDLIGNHQNALVFTGFSANNESILQAYSPTQTHRSFNVVKIADLLTDGTIFIQQAPRSDNYSLYNVKADSFPIWVYSSEETEDQQSFDQIQTMYNWNEKTNMYEQLSTTRVPGKKIAAKELARIQDGTIPTFQSFLDGLWYRTSSTGSSSSSNDHTRYLFFNPNDKEIIFFYESTQEVYDWINSTLRRNGIYISAANKSISNLVRYFDIALISVDEIRIRVNDDVRMLIGEDTLWDGIYKKKTQKTLIPTETNKKEESISIQQTLESGSGKWNFLNSLVIFTENSFQLTNNTEKINGVYTITTLFNTDLIQFRAEKKDCKLNGYFMYKNTSDKIDLIPVTVTTENCIIEGTKSSIKLEKFVE